MDKNIIQLLWEVPMVFLALLLLTRLQGKKTISHLTYFDYITGITLGDIAAVPLVDENVTLTRTLVALGLLGGLSILASYITTKSRYLRKLTEGEPMVVIKEGKILENNLRKMRLDTDNLSMLLRKKNVFSFSDVEFAVMETDGSLSLLKKAEKETVTRQDLGIKADKAKPGTELIIDGVLDEKKLAEMNLTAEWLQQTLQQNGFDQVEDVSYMEISGDGQVYIDRYNDPLQRGKK